LLLVFYGNNILDSPGALAYDDFNFWEWARLIFPEENIGKRLVGMLGAFVDESGTHTGGTYGPSTVVCIAGVIAEVDQWGKFRVEWKEALSKHNLGQFHMSEFSARPRRKPFEAMTDAEADILYFQRLLPIINVRVRAGILGIFPIDSYKVVIESGLKANAGKPYTACTAIFLRALREWAEEYGIKERIAFVFDRNREYYNEMRVAFEKAAIDPNYPGNYLLGNISSDDKRINTPLQAADILAHEAYRFWRFKLKDKSAVARLEAEKLLPGRIRGFCLERENLKTIMGV
jgi:hypothetical protein